MPAVLSETVAVTASVVNFFFLYWMVETRSRGSMATGRLPWSLTGQVAPVTANYLHPCLLLQGLEAMLQACAVTWGHQLSTGGEHQIQPGAMCCDP